jgi:hypothetical protein
MIRLQVILILLLIAFMACDPETLFRSSPVIDIVQINPNRVNPFDTVYASVLASNPEEGGLSYNWSVSPNNGIFLDPTDGTSVRWVAPTAGGDYVFKVVVSNAYKTAERTGSVKVIEAGDPLVRITSPQHNEYFVQMQEIDITTEAFHNNGIQKVQLFILDELISEQSGVSSNSYEFSFIPDTSYLGLTEIKVSAIANFTLTRGADSVDVNIEGIIPKIQDN